MNWDVPFLQQEDATILPQINEDEVGEIEIRPARASDVHGMSALINSYAAANVMLARGPLYLYQHLQDYIVAVTTLSSGREVVVGSGALNILWADLAEIRSLAVHKSCHHRGLGQKIVLSLLERSAQLEIPRVFCFTLVDDFFKKCGFRVFSRDLLPPVVWTECSKCPKFYHCDEISLIYELNAKAAPST